MASAVLQLGKNNASSRQDYWRRRMRMRWIEEHDEEDGEEPLDVCFPPHPLLFLALALAFWLSEMLQQVSHRYVRQSRGCCVWFDSQLR